MEFHGALMDITAAKRAEESCSELRQSWCAGAAPQTFALTRSLTRLTNHWGQWWQTQMQVCRWLEQYA